MRTKMRHYVMGALVFVLSSLFFLVIGDFFVLLFLPDRYEVWPPNFKRTFRPEPDIIHGITSPSYLTINAFGLRGDPLSDDEKYRLLAVGGSTTICVYLDDSKAWPYLLQGRLNEALGPKTVWVGNAGRPGHSTPQHILQVEKLLEQYPEIDGVVLLVGINDLLVALSATIDKPPVFDERPNEGLRRAFAVFPDWGADAPWYARNLIGRVMRLRSWHPIPIKRDGVFAMDEKGDFIKLRRADRKAASSFLHRLPDISAAVAVYARNLRAIVDHAERMSRRVVFLTQPTLWRDGMSQGEHELLWGGGTNFFAVKNGKPYYSAEALAEAMTIYNEALRAVCRERVVECVEMADMVPKTAKVFYDDAHFTEYGSAIVAERLAEYLLNTEPLSQGPDALAPFDRDVTRWEGR